MVSAIIASLDGLDMDIGDMDSGNEGMIMEVHLDSHANMVVLGKGCRVIAVSEYTAECQHIQICGKTSPSSDC